MKGIFIDCEKVIRNVSLHCCELETLWCSENMMTICPPERWNNPDFRIAFGEPVIWDRALAWFDVAVFFKRKL